MFDMVFNPKWTTLKKLIWLKAAILSGVASVIQTVTGNAPITLSNAIARSIKSLTQTGLCTQDDTPTPSAPVPIKCNNGTLTMVDDELPSGYKRVKGFSVDDDCYWKFTDFKLNGSDTLRFSFSVTAACNVIGSYSGSSSGNNYSLYVAVSGTGKYLRYKDGAYNSVIDTNTRYDVAITPTGSIGMKTDSTWDDLSFTTTTDFCVGTTSTSTTSAKLKGSLFGNVIVDGRMTLVPCERISDNVLGYYDLVGEAFYEPTAGTPTSLGYDGSHYDLQTVGTAEVITVGTQTASAVDLLSVGSYADEQNIISGGVTHMIGIKVLDGTESVSASGAGWAISIADKLRSKVAVSCTHYAYSSETMANAPDKGIIAFSSQNIGIKDSAFTDKTDVTNFFAAEYAAGHPVIVVYPLAEATTENVERQSLSTAAGTNTVSVTAEVSPVALSCEYYATE